MQLRADGSVQEKAQKLLSFTDNRQDASLQAGHFNDFIQVALIRSALHRALVKAGSLDHASVTPAVFATLGIKQEAYAKAPSDVDPGKSRNEKAMMQLLAYRLYEDLRRGWRVIQPNLEQCGLLEIEYPGLKELCETKANGPRIPYFRLRPQIVGTKRSMLSWIIYGEKWRLMPAYWTPLKSGTFASVYSRICAIRGHSTMMTLSARAFCSSYRERQAPKVSRSYSRRQVEARKVLAVTEDLGSSS